MAGELVEGDPFEGRPPPTTEPTARITVTPRRDEGDSSGGAGSNLVEGDPFAVTPGGMAKAYGIGTAQGAIGIPGMAGDITEAGKSAFEWLKSKLPDIPEPALIKFLKEESAKTNAQMGDTARGDVAGSFPLPTSKDIQGLVEKFTGKFYEPKNQAERDAATAGNYTTTAVLNPGGVIRKGVTALAGAGAEIAAGRFTDNNPYARALAGLLAGGGTSYLTGPGSVDRLLRSKLPPGITEAHVTQAGQLIERAANQPNPVRLTWPEALSQVTGQPVATDLQRILESNSRTRNQMQEFMAPRAGEIERAARGEAANIGSATSRPSSLGPQAKEVAEGTVRQTTQDINAAARPFYQRAEPVRVPPQVHQALMADPIYARTLREIRNNPELNATVAHLNDDAVGVVDLVQRRMRERGENLRIPGEASSSNTAAMNVERSRDLPIQVAERATGSRPGVAGDYEMARNIEAQLRGHFLDRLMASPIGRIAESDGQTRSVINLLFSKEPLANSQGEIHRAVQTLAAQRPAVAEAIVRQHIEMTLNQAVKRLQGGGNQFGGARLAKDLTGDPQQRANLRAAVEALPNGQVRWHGLEQMLEIMEATGQRQAKGSLTAFNAMELKDMSSSGLASLASKGLSPSKWTRWAQDAYEGWSAGRNLDDFANLITDPRSVDVFRRIALTTAQ